MFRACSLLIIRRYYSVYTATGIYDDIYQLLYIQTSIIILLMFGIQKGEISRLDWVITFFTEGMWSSF